MEIPKDNDHIILEICRNKNIAYDKILRELSDPSLPDKDLFFALGGIISHVEMAQILELHHCSFRCPHCKELNTIQSNDPHYFCNICRQYINVQEIMQREHRTIVPHASNLQYGKYKIVSEIGRGNMGIVYKAIQENLNRIVALKVAKQTPDREEAEVLKQYFSRERDLISKFNHPNIVQIYDGGDEFDIQYIAMEYVNGVSLTKFIQGSNSDKLLLSDKLQLLIQIGRGLQCAIDEKVVHRDIKPDNIMVTENGQVKIMDFGLAKEIKGNAVNQTQATMGTPLYMSPEQVRGSPINHTSDLYEYGCVIYELLTGKLPFMSSTRSELIRMILEKTPPTVRSHISNLPKILDSICAKLLKKNPEERYQSATEVVLELQKLLPSNTQYPSEEMKKIFHANFKADTKITSRVEVASPPPYVYRVESSPPMSSASAPMPGAIPIQQLDPRYVTPMPGAIPIQQLDPRHVTPMPGAIPIQQLDPRQILPSPIMFEKTTDDINNHDNSLDIKKISQAILDVPMPTIPHIPQNPNLVGTSHFSATPKNAIPMRTSETSHNDNPINIISPLAEPKSAIKPRPIPPPVPNLVEENLTDLKDPAASTDQMRKTNLSHIQSNRGQTKRRPAIKIESNRPSAALNPNPEVVKMPFGGKYKTEPTKQEVKDEKTIKMADITGENAPNNATYIFDYALWGGLILIMLYAIFSRL